MPPAHWRRPLSGRARMRVIGPTPRGPTLAPPHPWLLLCVSYRGGVSSEWSPPPARAAAASRGLPESGGRGERAWIGLTVIVAFLRLGGFCSESLLPPEWAFTAITHSLPGLPWRPVLRACRIGPAHTRVSGQLQRRDARRERGAREARRCFPPGDPGAARRGPRRKKGQPRLPAAVAAAVTV